MRKQGGLFPQWSLLFLSLSHSLLLSRVSFSLMALKSVEKFREMAGLCGTGLRALEGYFGQKKNPRSVENSSRLQE